MAQVMPFGTLATGVPAPGAPTTSGTGPPFAVTRSWALPHVRPTRRMAGASVAGPTWVPV